jgi:hypothetical protein
MVREHKLSPMEFIYLIKKKQQTNDAYNMRVVSFAYIQSNNLKFNNYYTLSAKGVTKFDKDGPKEFLNLGYLN